MEITQIVKNSNVSSINRLYDIIKEEFLKKVDLSQLTKEPIYDIIFYDEVIGVITKDKFYILENNTLRPPTFRKLVIDGFVIDAYIIFSVNNITIELLGTLSVLVKRLLPYYTDNNVEVSNSGIKIYTDVNDSFLVPLISNYHKKEARKIPELEKYDCIYINKNRVIINKKVTVVIKDENNFEVGESVVIRKNLDRYIDRYLMGGVL